MTIKVISLMVLFPLFLMACKEGKAKEPDIKDELVSLIPDSGQTTSYTITPGEDADFTINPPSSTENGNGTVTDNVTGLMWEKEDGGEMTFENASLYAENLTLAGYSDWRLPTGQELFDINYYDKVNPALSSTYFTKTTAEYWWTCEKRAEDVSRIWVVNAEGGLGYYYRTRYQDAGSSETFQAYLPADEVGGKKNGMTAFTYTAH